LRPAKGIDVLLDAVAMLRRRGQRLTLLVVGSGPSDAELREQAERLGIADATAFEGPQPIRAALERGRVMVIPSRAESLPYVILEAAAAAQPLISTDVGGIPEIFGPHASELIPPGEPGILAEAIAAKLSESEAERTAKAETLSRFVHSRFSLDQMVDGVLAGYGDAFAARGMEPARSIA
jgi:glycosyltransferase involved in cell wall biosynthesis